MHSCGLTLSCVTSDFFSHVICVMHENSAACLWKSSKKIINWHALYINVIRHWLCSSWVIWNVNVYKIKLDWFRLTLFHITLLFTHKYGIFKIVVKSRSEKWVKFVLGDYNCVGFRCVGSKFSVKKQSLLELKKEKRNPSESQDDGWMAAYEA